MEELANGYGIQALDHNEVAAAIAGSGIVSGCAASDGTNSMEVDVASGTALVDGSKVSVSAQTVTLSSADGTYPRKDVVYIDSTGSAAVAQGVAEEAEPSNVTGRDTYRPSPADLSATAAAVVAEVWVGAGVSDIGSGDITDRRSLPNMPEEFMAFTVPRAPDELVAPYLGDETEETTTSTTYVTIKEARFVVDRTNLFDIAEIWLKAEAKNSSSGSTTTLGLFVDGTERITVSTTNASYTLLSGSWDASGLADGVHTVALKMKVGANTGYNRLFEAWGK